MKKRISYILLALGIVLVAGAVALVIVTQIGQDRAKDEADRIVRELYAAMPHEHDSFPDDRIDTSMARMELDGSDFVGILTIPAYGCRLPVYADWEPARVTDYPCRYDGSMHDGTLIIGGSDNSGQLDMMENISIGDAVSVTDVSGARYRYEVAQIILTDDVSRETLSEGEYPLVFFARDTYGLHYTVVRCDH